MTDLTVDSSAREQAHAIRAGQISARELLDLHLARIAERNPELNAIVSLDEERAREGAAAADEATARAQPVGPLHGLPHAFKDTHDVAGWRTTYGSPLYRRPRPRRRRPGRRADPPGRGRHDRQDQRAGVRGRVPHVQHDLRHHPQPRRPHTLGRRVVRRSGVRAGGRDGPARGRLRHGRLAAQPRQSSAVSSGSGRRSAGCPTGRPRTTGNNLSTAGPMARNVGDLALLLSVMAGPDRRTPFALSDPGPAFRTSRLRHPQPACGSPCPPTSAAPSTSMTRSPRWCPRPRRRSPPPARPSRRRAPTCLSPTTSSARSGPGSSRPPSASSWPSTPGRSRSPSPTTSAPGRGSRAPTSPAPSNAAPP